MNNKLYVFTDYKTDYTQGLAFALAPNLRAAKKAIVENNIGIIARAGMKKYEMNSLNNAKMAVYPCDLNTVVCASVEGSG